MSSGYATPKLGYSLKIEPKLIHWQHLVCIWSFFLANIAVLDFIFGKYSGVNPD